MLKIYSSSAGSGKTYTLTREYLRLALDPDQRAGYFGSILAITFTNAAANEMRNRILKELVGISGEQSASPLLNDLTRAFSKAEPGTPAFEAMQVRLRQRAALVFRTILHNYADFSVTTIDAFTQRVVTAFTDELGLPYSFDVEMDTEAVLEVAIDNLIEKAGTDEMAEITTILSEYYRLTAEDGKSWNQLPATLKEFGKNLTSDQHYDAVSAVQALSPTALRTIRSQLVSHNRTIEADIVGHAQRAWSLITGAGLTEDDFKGKRNSLAAYFKAIVEKEPHKEPSATHRTQRTTGDLYMAKGTPLSVMAAIDAMADELCACFDAIDTIRATSGQQLALFDALIPHLQKMALLGQMRVEFDDLLRRDGRVHISEFNKKILSIVSSEPVPFLYERLGTRYNHILIDEFQDTSRLQFANLLPLIENSLAAGNFNLVVGDGKQAIYRFRGGDMDQIVALHRQDLDSLKETHGVDSWTADRLDTLHGLIEPELLDTNWRSARPIIEFNNQFFEFTARAFEQKHPRIADVFDAARQFHQKTSERTPEKGHVQINFIPKEKDSEVEDGATFTRQMLDKTLELLNKALAEGYQYGDIAILCRKKDHARMLANELNRLRIPLISADSLSLEFSEPVKWLIAVMQVLQRPDQLLLRYELLYLYHRVIRGIFPNDTLTEQLRAVAQAGHDAVFAYLQAEGYPLDPYALGQLNPYELTEQLTAQFNLFNQAEHNPFLFRFLDEVLTFNQKQSGHLSDFLVHWEGVRQKISVEGALVNAVSIQTIHKSKGLEFPVVIIPFANWSTTPNAQGTMWVDLAGLDIDALTYQADTGEVSRLVSAPVQPSKSLEKAPEPVGKQYTEEVARTFLENMNLLYVAFTRPTDRLYILTQAPKATKSGGKAKAGDDPKSGNVADWLLHFLTESDMALSCGNQWQEGQTEYVLHVCSDGNTHQKRADLTGQIVVDTVISGSRGQNLQLRRQADRVFDVATFERTRERDRKLAAALSLLRGAADLDRALRRLVSEGLVRQAEQDELRASLQAIVEHPDLYHLFDPTLRVDTDRSILSNNKLMGAPHRVVHFPDGRVVLVQYESVTAAETQPETDPTASLTYFTRLYRDMGFPNVEGRLVWLAAEPIVVSVV